MIPLKLHGEEVIILLPEIYGAVAGPFLVLEKPTPFYVISNSTPQSGQKTRTFHRNLLKRFIQPTSILQVVLADDDPEETQLNLVYSPGMKNDTVEAKSFAGCHISNCANNSN